MRVRRAVLMAFGLAIWSMSGMAVAGDPERVGYFNADDPRAKGAGIRFAGGRFCFVDRAGYPTSQEVPYRVLDSHIEVGPFKAGAPPLHFRVLQDGRLEIRLPDVGLMTFSPRFASGAAVPRDRLPAEPTLAPDPAPSVRGTWVDAGGRVALRFVGNVVLLSGGRPDGSDVPLPYEQKGARITLVGPHMNETLLLLDDGRLMLKREHMIPVFYRRMH